MLQCLVTVVYVSGPTGLFQGFRVVYDSGIQEWGSNFRAYAGAWLWATLGGCISVWEPEGFHIGAFIISMGLLGYSIRSYDYIWTVSGMLLLPHIPVSTPLPSDRRLGLLLRLLLQPVGHKSSLSPRAKKLATQVLIPTISLRTLLHFNSQYCIPKLHLAMPDSSEEARNPEDLQQPS